MVPDVSGTSPSTPFSSVDLPAPFGPMSATASPGSTVSSRPDTPAPPGYVKDAPSRRSTGESVMRSSLQQGGECGRLDSPRLEDEAHIVLLASEVGLAIGAGRAERVAVERVLAGVH